MIKHSWLTYIASQYGKDNTFIQMDERGNLKLMVINEHGQLFEMAERLPDNPEIGNQTDSVLSEREQLS